MRLRSLLVLLVLTTLPAAGFAQYRVEDLSTSAEIVYLRKNCAGEGLPSGRCVTDDADDNLTELQAWVWNSWWNFTPNTDLVVDIGPGEFTGKIDCPSGRGSVTFRGNARDHTRILGNGIFFTYTYAVKANACVGLAFEDMTLVGASESGLAFAVYWDAGGRSSWTNVSMKAEHIAWYESGICRDMALPGPPLGEHFFWNVEAEAGAVAHWSECDLAWFYGSDLVVLPVDSTPLSEGNLVSGIRVGGRGDVRLFGSSVRVSTKNRTSAISGGVYGADVGVIEPGAMLPGYGHLHFHGGIITAEAGNLAGAGAVGIRVEGGSGGDAHAHTHETAFRLVPASGATATRLTGTGKLQSPFLWEAGTAPPQANFSSQTGQDVYIETDCNASGCSGGADPHIMIYKAACSPSPWFDVSRNLCRQ